MANFRNVSLAFILFIEITCIFTGSNAKITGKLGDTATMAKQDSSTTAGTKASKGKNQEPTIDYNKTICGALGKSMAKIRKNPNMFQNDKNIIGELLTIVKETLKKDKALDNTTKAAIPEITIKDIKNEIAKLTETLGNKKPEAVKPAEKQTVDGFINELVTQAGKQTPITQNENHLKQITELISVENINIDQMYTVVSQALNQANFKEGLMMMITQGQEQEGCLKLMAAPAA